ncbi:hypothetical protein GCM10007860_25980 [Chitiniphilus shinanonensis]|uniref:Uncharacterized protein n=1 Tax=Chitiniphilus shinanonensis TaxID=553088 RepID=A0ABQ6BTW3_9NEIS|nr:hypothetical protein [Chitiniphilus shinanonensis]GLS05445.1 hypothetical protein GCM10007860_25980 [Chitiniphilus shinanonensis]
MKIQFSYISGGAHPLVGETLYWQPKVVEGEGSARYDRYMCGALGAIAQTVEDCSRILEFIEEIKKGNVDKIETGGNDVTLKISKFGVQVDIEINDQWVGQPEGMFLLNEWERVLIGWREFIKMPRSLDTVFEVEL